MVEQSLADVVNRFIARGYTDDFRAEHEGLRAIKASCTHAPENLIIDDVARFEGASDPDDEAIVFALRCKVHGSKGTYVTSYGAKMSAVDAEMTRRLDECRCGK